MVDIRKGNPYAAIMVVMFCVMIFMGYWVMMPAYAKLHEIFTDDTDLEEYDTEFKCSEVKGYWVNENCSHLPEAAQTGISQQRRAWLTAPFIFVLGLILWLVTKSTNRDHQGFEGQL